MNSEESMKKLYVFFSALAVVIFVAGIAVYKGDLFNNAVLIENSEKIVEGYISDKAMAPIDQNNFKGESRSYVSLDYEKDGNEGIMLWQRRGKDNDMKVGNYVRITYMKEKSTVNGREVLLDVIVDYEVLK